MVPTCMARAHNDISPLLNRVSFIPQDVVGRKKFFGFYGLGVGLVDTSLYELHVSLFDTPDTFSLVSVNKLMNWCQSWKIDHRYFDVNSKLLDLCLSVLAWSLWEASFPYDSTQLPPVLVSIAMPDRTPAEIKWSGMEREGIGRYR